jgi:thymidylate synthase (FAD)
MELDIKLDYLDDGISFVSLKDRMVIDSPLKTVNSARISYNKEKKVFEASDGKLSNFLWNAEHTSPFRHSYFTFHVKLPIFVARQFMKYQVGSGFRTYEVNGEEVSLEVFDHVYSTDSGTSWNEVSGRYTQTSDQFYVPKKMRSNPAHGNKQSSGEYVNPTHYSDEDFLTEEECILQIINVGNTAKIYYNRLIKNGVAKEIARLVLPPNFYTECYWTASLQAIIHFLKQRTKSDSQHEIRVLAEGIYSLIKSDLDKLGIKKEDL